MKKPLLYFMTMGCPKNQVDSRQIRGMMLEKGYSFSDTPQEAEMILINTCGFVDDAKEESIRAILELSRWKKKGRCEFLIVIGCLVQKYGDELAEALPEADLLLGVTDWVRLEEEVEALWNCRKAKLDAKKRLRVGPPDQHLFSNKWALLTEEEPAGYVKIAEGCNHRCTFCVIPQIRGGYRSREPDSVVAEVAARAAAGLREAVLVAQDTGAYGKDLKPASSLAQLLRRLCGVKELERIRVMYCYPEGVTDELIEAMKHPKVCPYLDMPVQHADDAVLRRMGRPVSGGGLKGIIRKLRQSLPGLVLRTTLMTGFPGETEASFQVLLDFLEEYRFERAGFFAFSPQPGTPAADMPDQVPQEEKERRLEAAQEKQSGILSAWHGSLVGRTLEVFVDEKTGGEKGLYHYEGRTVWDAPEIDGFVTFSSGRLLEAGELVKVRITHSGDYILSGEITDEPCQ